jgi:radical SAM superfamily enzyme YgiQ (UPF0313 family)
MKVTLVDIQLPTVERREGSRLAREPIGLLELGAFIREKKGIDVSYVIIDDENSGIEEILDQDTEVVGFSTYSYNYPIAVQLARKLRNVRKDSRIVFGGPHTGMIPEIVYNENKGVIDCCVADEGELAFLDFLDGKNGIIRRERIPLDQIQRADRIESLLDNSNFSVLNYKNYKTAVVLASRGCSRSCDFCITRLTGYRAKLQDIVIDEIKNLVSNHGVEVIMFEDPLLNGNLQHLENLLDQLISERQKKLVGDFYAVGSVISVLEKGMKKFLKRWQRQDLSR